MFKNISSKQISIYIALSIGLSYCLWIAFGLMTFITLPRWILFLFIVIPGSILSYIFTKYLLDRFLFRRIKVIYKIISSSKLDPSESFNVKKIKDKDIDMVNNEVEEWAEETKKEIQYFKTLESYRKNFVGNLSHELKTPIFSIQGYLHTLLDGGIYDDQVNRKYLERAASNVDRLQTIVEDLEVIHKLESGVKELEMVRFDIKALAKEVFIDLEFMAKKKRINLGFKEGASHPYFVLADRENIRQVLLNLISNSIKYGNENGSTKVSFYNMEDKLLIEVTDDGIGMEENHLKHVFDRFYRVDRGRSRKQGGSGLGLSIVKHIVDAHHQTINVRSTPNVGSTFGFTLLKAS